ncbi:unnamed protein product [Symbiodinium microadriaticum]|nr:unnamed protein product [Symbiodinium microadriaticum]
MWFAPHVFSSIVWWNFAWIQLIKWIRAKHIWLHRLNGRIQVTAMMGQIITGIGLASGSPTHGVKMLSIAYGLAMAYVLANTIYYVRVKDIVRHKYWATKLFGYSQAIALQRCTSLHSSLRRCLATLRSGPSRPPAPWSSAMRNPGTCSMTPSPCASSQPSF